MFRDASEFKKIILLTGRVDLRKGINGLAALVQLKYDLNTLEEGSIFLFCGVRKDRIKALAYESSGYCLYYFRLTNGKFNWPRKPEEAREVSLEQFHRLMDGYTIDSTIKTYPKKADPDLTKTA